MNRLLGKQEVSDMDAPDLFKFIAGLPGYGVWVQDFAPYHGERKPVKFAISLMPGPVGGRTKWQGEFK